MEKSTIYIFSVYVAIVCPCSEKVCIPKCCKTGFYFSTVENICKPESDDDVPSYTPELSTSKNTEIENRFYLIQRQPKCNNSEKFMQVESEIRPLYVQQNGSLMAQFKTYDKFHYLDNNRWVYTGCLPNTFDKGMILIRCLNKESLEDCFILQLHFLLISYFIPDF